MKIRHSFIKNWENMEKIKQWVLRGRNIEIGSITLAWLLLFLFVLIMGSCSPKNGVIKSKCYNSKWHVSNN